MAQKYPEGVTEEWIAEKKAKAKAQAEKDGQLFFSKLDNYLEAYASGEWLADKLHELECPGDVIGSVVQSHGQIACHVPAWEAAQTAVDAWVKTGFYEKPGRELAERLIAKYGIPVHTIAKLIDDLGIEVLDPKVREAYRLKLEEKMKNSKF